jgi:hypothetical protein
MRGHREHCGMVTSRVFLGFGLLTIAAAGLLAACGDDDSDEPTPADTPTAATGTPATATPDGATPTATATEPPAEDIPFETPATSFTKDGEGMEVAILADVRAARNEGFDRVVIEFEGDAVPGYEVRYVESIFQCGSGERVDIGGAALVSVVLTPAAGHTEAGEATVPRQVPTQGTAAVQEVMAFCDFEAMVGYGIGLASVRPYRVFELSSPPRLVIDFSQ